MRIGGGDARGRRLKSGRKGIRPTTARVKSALFSMLGPGGPAGRRVLDLFAGSGALGVEALSRGAVRAEFVEADERRCQEIRGILTELGMAERARVHCGDATKVSRRLDGEFDIVFIDPPYEKDPFEEVLSALNERGALAEDAVIFAEHSVRLVLPERLPGARLERRRRYGDTAVSVYRREQVASQGQ